MLDLLDESLNTANVCLALLWLNITIHKRYLSTPPSSFSKQSRMFSNESSLFFCPALTNNLIEIAEDNQFAESVTYSNIQRKRWSLLTSIRRRLGESRDRMQSSENNKLRSKSAESCKGSSPTFSKSIYSQCTPLRRNRRRCFLGQSREN